MILSHQNGISSTQYKDLDIPAGLPMLTFMYMVDSSMKPQTFHWRIFAKLIFLNCLHNMRTSYKKSNLRKKEKRKIRKRKLKVTRLVSTIWIGNSSLQIKHILHINPLIKFKKLQLKTSLWLLDKSQLIS